MKKGISNYVYCANFYDIFESQVDIWYFTKNTFLKHLLKKKKLYV